MKIIAMYLPQFHRVKENDEWWGEGFTEWTTVKAAKPLYENHYQPHQPFNGDYYDLSNKHVMLGQVELMKKYSIDGMCFYHYWFKDGRRILEKPAENLLEWTDVDMPFCFCWANETWARSWSNIREKNVWADAFENDKVKNCTGILLEQSYGEKADWRLHFEYLLSFFRDNRYIKVDNKPVIMLYKSNLIFCLEEMLKKWREWAKEEGFNDLYVIAGNVSEKQKNCIDATISLEPASSFGVLKTNSDGLKFYQYAEIWENILNYSDESNNYYEALVGYDTTPRRGKNGVVVEGSEPESFKSYLAELLAKSEVEQKEFVFLNAWNEWGEGMHLEPDRKYGFAYLDAVKKARECYKDYVTKFDKKSSLKDKEFEAVMQKCNRYETYWKVFENWLTLKEDGKTISDYVKSMGWNSIAVYGAGMMGMHLLKDFECNDVQIDFIVDSRGDSIKSRYKVFSVEDKLPKVDVVIVSVTYDYNKITETLRNQNLKKIVFLEEIIMAIMDKR